MDTALHLQYYVSSFIAKDADFEKKYRGFIIIHWISIFVGFVGTGEPRVQIFNEYHTSIGLSAENGKTTKSNIHQYASFHDN